MRIDVVRTIATPWTIYEYRADGLHGFCVSRDRDQEANDRERFDAMVCRLLTRRAHA